MIHLFFKTIWNNRKRNILVFTELFMISLVLFNLTVYLMNIFDIYRIKNCYDTNNVVLIQINKKADEDPEISEQTFSNLKKVLAANQFVESVSVCNNATPYNYNTWRDEFVHDSERIGLDPRFADIEYAKVMKITPLKGRWFDETDQGKQVRPMLISKEADEKYFHGSSVGERMKFQNREYEIIGVTERFKRSDIERPDEFGYIFKDSINPKQFWGGDIIVRTRENHTGDMLAIAESQVYSTLDPGKWTIGSLNTLENMHSTQNSDSYQRNFMTIIIAVFVMINIFLGTIGILWYNTNLRFHEIGIRRAVGATGMRIRQQFISESLVMALAGLLVVVIIIAQGEIYIGRMEPEPGVITRSIWLSSAVMILLVMLSTWLPAHLASKIRPADALKTE